MAQVWYMEFEAEPARTLKDPDFDQKPERNFQFCPVCIGDKMVAVCKGGTKRAVFSALISEASDRKLTSD